jgi:hypothetical protein
MCAGHWWIQHLYIYWTQYMNQHEPDPVEEVVKHMHIVLPIVGAVLIFMLAAIAIVMA